MVMLKQKRGAAFFGLVCLLASSIAGISATGADAATITRLGIDETYGTGGVAVVDLFRQERVLDMVVQPDGKSVLVGAFEADTIVERVLPDGRVDTGFGNGGQVRIPSTLPANRVELMRDGRIVLSGANLVARLQPDGSFDTSFGGDGVVTLYGTSEAMAPDAEGRVLFVTVMADETGQKLRLQRFTADGTVDEPFSPMTMPLPGFNIPSPWGANGAIHPTKLVIQSDGRILVAGAIWGGPNQTPFLMLVRYLASGALDQSFGNGGVAEGWPGVAQDVVLQPDGQIVVAALPAQFGETESLLARFDTAGRLDRTFGVGLGPKPESANTGAPFGKHLLAREAGGGWLYPTSHPEGSRSGYGLARYDAAGRRDPTFGEDGILPLFENRLDVTGIGAVASAPDGQVMVALQRSGPWNESVATGDILLQRIGQVRIPSGYWMLTGDGAVAGFGDAKNYGRFAHEYHWVDIEPARFGKGYWGLSSDGAVVNLGSAKHFGGPMYGSLPAGETAASLSATPSGNGYWIFTNRGRVLAYGDAPFLGDMSGTKLNGPVLGSVATPSGKGYYMVASDGGIFAFGDATFTGSMGGKKLNAPVQSLVPDSDGKGYWLVASDGGIFAFDAPFGGSMGDTKLNKPVVAMVRYGDGYLMVGADGGIFNFSSLPFSGSLGDKPPPNPVVAVAALP
jgi:uncharacterized delta-60 repeat protein